ncbi:hypothetical protein DYB28_003159 [Aphanomyces astaci]|uniref:Uncharacterized protein n=1 Tax=Aphanomyces astaci TaxID=112090 RepID=A0A3L6VAL7_APHAT|nr:hypothetical protein DYB34_002378 [Aphanomyces astaci]RLO05789.1 hypothetical protein DYB28_003159 [Aphanomyces astaci]
MAQRDPAAAISMHLGVKKRKHNDTSKSTTSGDLASSLAPCFLSQSQLEGMSDYDYADMDHNAFAPSPQVMTLEDTILKVKRLQAEGNTLAEAGLFQAAIARWQHGLDIDPTNGTLYELQAQAYLASNDVFRSIQAG